MAAAEIQLTFGTYTADKPTQTVQKFKPFLDYLSEKLSDQLQEPVKIKMQISGKYEQGIDELVNGTVDFSRFGPASYVSAKDRNTDIEIIAMESQNGKKTFKGIIAVHEDSDIQTLADLADRSFAFGDPLSTIGRYLAQSELIEAGIFEADLSDHAFLGRHDRVGTAVGKKDYDAGALKSSTFKKLQDKNVPIRKLVDFDNVTKPWIVRSDMDPRIVEAMRVVMLSATDKDVLKTVSKSGFIEGSDADYDDIRSAIAKSATFN
ncbi:hypothetical protein GCM10007939_02290 [Amylibacter marinus]|uniref:Phosphonate transport system substrate-binding protein n=2 Tax=Amylibacter marinus TaxID=1475483 RepID=A0ABQ5VRB9_9RHOB|nr:hypothetical protein GCM10007939_02290 [Amylibacter marinus]